eukprot:9030767-Pyramimonas_sp.AAC.1
MGPKVVRWLALDTCAIRRAPVSETGTFCVELAKQIKMAGFRFTISADWQLTPQQLQASGWVDGVGGVIVASEQGTVAPFE